MKKVITVIAVTIILFSFLACKKKEEQPVPQAPAQGPIVDPHAAVPGYGTMPHGTIEQEKIDFQIVVPTEVKEAWSSVKLAVTDKTSNKEQEFTVAIGEEIKVPGSDLTVKVLHFLPDFKMTGQIITSASNDTNNPSAGITVYENDKQIFPASGELGWLYSKFPSIHPFQHDQFDLTLKEGVKK